jgi:hypothetical protein
MSGACPDEGRVVEGPRRENESKGNRAEDKGKKEKKMPVEPLREFYVLIYVIYVRSLP